MMLAGPGNNGTPSPFRLCQVHLSPDDPSQTFARAHAERLPCRVLVVHGERARHGGRGARPLYLDGAPISSDALPARVLRRGRAELWSLRGRDPEELVDAAAYYKAFRRARCDAVLVEFGNVAVRAMSACERLDLPLIVHFHGFDVHSRGILERYADAYQALFGQAAALVGVSEPMCAALRELGAPPDKVHRVPNGVDPDRFADAAPDRAAPTFLAVGRFVEKKAPQLTIAAFASVRRRRADVRLRMIGDGDLRNACNDLVRGLGLDGSVTLLGPQPHDVVADEMRRARAFVQHSIVAADGDSEGMPVAILEASASGLPVVATRHAGIPEVVVEDQTGFLVDEHDVEGMAAHMERLALEPPLAARIGAAGRRRVAEQFTMDASIGRLWAVIQSASGQSSGR
jgi:colanic acid/amylovoran biosynthesis glycosyltransferase